MTTWAPLIDQFGRRHNNLRLSVTDRCNIRCRYCMPESQTFLPKDHLLTFEELTRLATIAAKLGVNKIRLTGGEPLLRQEVSTLVSMLNRVPGIDDLAMTTNGVQLAPLAKTLRQAGLKRLNISLDTLDRTQFEQLTRRDELPRVLAGIDAAQQVGFASIKINAIAIKGFTESQVVPLAEFCRERGFELRFIEFMPLEADQIWQREQVLSADELLSILERAGLLLEPIPADDPNAPASEYRYVDGLGTLGIVASVTRPFCGTCNRIRITAEGKFRNCLFALDEVDLKGAMRGGADDALLATLMRSSVEQKWAGHLINSDRFIRPTRTMHSIGG